MTVNVLNLVDNFEKINFGIWNAATSTAGLLRNSGVRTFIAGLGAKSRNIDGVDDAVSVGVAGFGPLRSFMAERGLTAQNTVVASHGCWKAPTILANRLKLNGFQWVACPHGMLEPWSLSQNRLRKNLYFRSIERRLLLRASVLRAVGSPEFANLKRLLPQASQIELIPNGISTCSHACMAPIQRKLTFLFLGRLHAKKGPSELVAAFCSSSLANSDSAELVVAGPDQGELATMKKIADDENCSNVRFPGPVFGESKERLLNAASYFVLPSQSEGFPTSVLEAMSHYCVPIVSEGCNFPEAAEAGLSIPITTAVESVRDALEKSASIDIQDLEVLQQRCKSFVDINYSLQAISDQQAALVRRLLSQPE